MIQGESVLTIIPARGKSKGIAHKNLALLTGKSLIQHTAETLQQVDFIDHCVVSTDDEDIKNEAIKCGLEVPFMRPEEISGDLISDLQVLQHAIVASEKYFKKAFDIILMIQPTCPLRRAHHLSLCVHSLLEHHANSAWTVSKVDTKHHPSKQLRLSGDALCYFSQQGSEIIARQQLSQTYIRNGACYAWKRAILFANEATILPEKTCAVILQDELISIDSVEDLQACEQLLAQ